MAHPVESSSSSHGRAPAVAEGAPPRARPGETLRAITAESSGRYRASGHQSGRPPRRAFRASRAYWVTFLVIASYQWLSFRSRFHSEEWTERALRRVHLRNARRIERAICELQGLFIKVGQLISIMTNFLPEEFRRQLEGLQDTVPPRPYADIEERIREELGKSPTEIFAHFEERPMASASIGQVHVARLHDGETVAVKVQYPDIDEVVRSDLRTLRRIFGIIEYFVPYQGLDEMHGEIQAIVTAELDFRAEADSAELIASNFAARRDVAFPKVIHELSTSRVLTTRFESGCKISDVAALRRLGIDKARLARKVVEIYCQQIFTDGIYHADPHPGNLLVRSGPNGEPTVVFLDFGAVARVPPQLRQGIVELIEGALTRNTGRIVKAMKQMGFVARGADDRVFEQVIEYFHARFQETLSLESFNLKDIKFDPEKAVASVADLRRMDITIRELSESFHIPKEFIVLERTFLLLMGLCTELDATLNPMTVIQPYLERFVVGDEGDFSHLLVESSKDLVITATALPAEIRKFLRTAQAGELTLRWKGLEAHGQLLYRLGHQAIFAAIGIAGASFALVLEGRGDLPRAEWAWWTARISAGLLLWSWWGGRAQLRRRR